MLHRNGQARWNGPILLTILSTIILPTITPPRALARGTPVTLDLPGALRLARERSPLLQAARLRIAEAHGDLTGASTLLVANPELEVAVGPRLPDAPGNGPTTDAEAGLVQRLETGGQRRHRIEAAEKLLSATRAEAADVDRVVSLAVANAFHEVLAATERTRLTEENELLARELMEVSRVRVTEGAEAPVVLNAARIRLAEARRRALEARAEEVGARVRLARVLGLPPGTPIALSGTLPTTASVPPLEALLRDAVTRRPDVLAFARRADGARAESRLADAAAWPDLTLGIRSGLDEGDRVLLGAAGIALPLFARNQGERERSRATVLRIDAELRDLRLGVEAEIREARARLEAAVNALAIYDGEVLGAQRENLGLLRTAYQAGKIDYSEVVLLQRELLEGQLGYLDARLALARAEATLRAVAGMEVVAAEGGEP